MSVPQYFDDGTTLTTGDDGTVSAGGFYNGGDYALAVANAGSDGTGAFDILNKFGGFITQAGSAVATIQAQADAFRTQQAARELAKQKQDAAVSITKLNTQREVTLAALKNQSLALLSSPSTLIVIAGAAAAIYFLSKR